MKMNEVKRPCFGIDLGTSNTEISMYHNGKVTTLGIPQHLTKDGRRETISRRMPSLVCFAEDGRQLFGEVFRTPRRDMYDRYGSVIVNTKRMLLHDPDEPVGSYVRNRKEVQVTPRHVAQLLLKQCWVAAERAGYQQGDPVMITVPCAYQMDQIHATLDAARKAGFSIPANVELITEPVAALIEYIFFQNPKIPTDDPRFLNLDEPCNVLVYDLGGGTLDLALVRIEKTESGFRFTELSNNDTDLTRAIGGADFDNEAMNYFLEEVIAIEARKRSITSKEMKELLGEDMALLKEQIQGIAYNLKEEITNNRCGMIEPIVLPNEMRDDLDNEAIRFTLNGDEGYTYELSYMKCIWKFLNSNTEKNILSRIRYVLEHAYYEDLSPVQLRNVDKLLVTGGMTNFPPVMEALEKYLKDQSMDEQSPFNLTILKSTAGLDAVSIGAAYSHTLTIENRRSYRPRKYFLDVTEGLPIELGKDYRNINLPNPNLALFNIYGGVRKSDPNLRLQYSYQRRFKPNLTLPACIDFSFKLEKTGEGVLEGTVRHYDGVLPKMRFREAWEDKSYAESKNSTEMEVLSRCFGGIIEKSDKRLGKNGVFYGVEVPKLANSEKQVFRSCSDVFTAEQILAQAIEIMDLNQVGNPIPERFDDLIDLLLHHYQFEPELREIPALQYALYSLRQLQLSRIKIPSFPPRPEEVESMVDDDMRDISYGIDDLCQAVAELYLNGSEELKNQLNEELIHCINNWSWSDIFQVILSIAQHAGNYEWAALLHKRVMKRRDRIRAGRVEAMTSLDKHTQNRLAQTYLNYLNDGGEPTRYFCEAVEILFRDRFEFSDEHWYNCDLVKDLLRKIPDNTRARICQNDKRLITLLEEMDPSTANLPDDLKQILYRMPRDTDMRRKVWERVNSFLDDPKSKWSMMRVLSERGKRYDETTVSKILDIKEPEEPAHQKTWIRTLACCKNNKTAESILEKLWMRCALYQKYKMIENRNTKEEYVMLQIEKASLWLQDEQFLEDVINDNSIDILVAMSLIRDKDQLRRSTMLSALIAVVPNDWDKQSGNRKKIWKRLVNAVHIFWNNLDKYEENDFRVDLNYALKQLAYTANRYPENCRKLDRALFNFCRIFYDGKNPLKMYNSDLVYTLKRLFINSGEVCPLSTQTQYWFLRVLDKRYMFPDIQARKNEYRELLIRWCEITTGQDNRTLVNSRVFLNIVGYIPEAKG